MLLNNINVLVIAAAIMVVCCFIEIRLHVMTRWYALVIFIIIGQPNNLFRAIQQQSKNWCYFSIVCLTLCRLRISTLSCGFKFELPLIFVNIIRILLSIAIYIIFIFVIIYSLNITTIVNYAWWLILSSWLVNLHNVVAV